MKFLKKLLDRFNGKKTYVALCLFIGALIAQLCGVPIPDTVLYALGAMAGLGGRSAIKSAVGEVKDVADKVKDISGEVRDVRDAVKKLNIPKL